MTRDDIIYSLERCASNVPDACRDRKYAGAASNGKWRPMTTDEARSWLLTNKYERPPIYEEIYPDLPMGPSSWSVPTDSYFDRPIDDILDGYGEIFRWWNFTPENYYDIINDTEWN